MRYAPIREWSRLLRLGVYDLCNVQAFASALQLGRGVSSIDKAVEDANQEISEFFGEAVSSQNVAEKRMESDAADLTHVDASGAAVMVDTSQKAATFRVAKASVKVLVGPEAFEKIRQNQIKKGDVLTVSKIAGIMAAKHTSLLLPLCHSINLSGVDVEFELDEAASLVRIKTRVSCTAGTGVEMEALTAAGIAALNVIDMIKAVNKQAVITDLRLDYKAGGKSGTFTRSHP